MEKPGAAGGFGKAIADEIAYAVNDIRQKVVEEPWFGRAVTPEVVSEVPALSFEEAAGLKPLQPEGDALGRTQDSPARPAPGMSFEEASGLGPCREAKPGGPDITPPGIDR
jgi:hypothetical protein